MKPPTVFGTVLAFWASLYFLYQQPHPRQQTEPPSSITGNVTLRGEPVPGALILVGPAPRGGEPVASTKTSDNGQFRITGLPPGRYNIKVKALGLASQQYALGAFGHEVILGPGETHENINFVMVRGGAITGRVSDFAGKPLVEELISITTPSNSPPPYFDNVDMLRTDDRGVYRIYGLPPGRHKVSVGDGGSRYRKLDYGLGYYPRTFHPNVQDESKARIIEVAEGTEISGIDISVGQRLRTYEASGRIVNAVTGQPQPGIKWGYDGNAISTFGKLSDEGGGFRITGLMPGRYSVFAGCEGDFYSGKLEFEVSNHDVDDLVIRRNPGASIRGKVVVEGSKDPAILSKLHHVSLIARGEASYVNTKIEPDGSFYFCGLQPGKQKVEVNALMRTGFWLSRIERNGMGFGDGIEVSAGDHLTDVRVVLAHHAGVIRGQLTYVDYELPAGSRFQILARLVGETDISQHLFAETDSQGRFVIEGLAPGEYKLSMGGFMSSVPGFLPPPRQLVEQRVIVTNGTDSTVNLVLKGIKK